VIPYVELSPPKPTILTLRWLTRNSESPKRSQRRRFACSVMVTGESVLPQCGGYSSCSDVGGDMFPTLKTRSRSPEETWTSRESRALFRSIFSFHMRGSAWGDRSGEDIRARSSRQ